MLPAGPAGRVQPAVLQPGERWTRDQAGRAGLPLPLYTHRVSGGLECQAEIKGKMENNSSSVHLRPKDKGEGGRRVRGEGWVVVVVVLVHNCIGNSQGPFPVFHFYFFIWM